MRFSFIRPIYPMLVCCWLLSSCDSSHDIETLSTYPGSGKCSIDNPERNSTIIATDELRIRGWAYHTHQSIIPQTLTLYLINEETRHILTVPINRGEKRGDVAKAFGNPILEDSGFSGSLVANSLKTGKYQLILLQADRNIDVVRCGGEPHYIMVH